MTRALEDESDPLLDACLAEVLGGDKPPDLTARILEAWKARRDEGAGLPSSLPIAERWDVSVRGRISTSPAAAPRAATGRWGRRVAVAATLLVAVGLGCAAWRYVQGPGRTDSQLAGSQPGRAPRTPVRSLPRDRAPPGGATSVAHVGSDAHPAGPVAGGGSSGKSQATELEAPFGAAEQPSRQVVNFPKPVWPAPQSDDEIVALADVQIRAVWREQSIQPSPPADDTEWCRRVYVRMLGRIPSVSELQQYVADDSPHKRRELVTRLQSSEEYADEYASYWATYWTNTLIGRSGGTQPGDLANRPALFGYLREVIQQDRPFDEVVEELLTAQGANAPGSGDYDPAVNFLLAHDSPDATVATAKVARLFLGQSYHCAQCHNHPSNSALAQENYWQLNALLRQARAERAADGQDAAGKAADNVARLVDRDVPQDVTFFEQLDGYQRAVHPALPDGTKIDSAGRVAEVRRREVLGRWLRHSQELPRSLVHRVWSHFMGYGFTYPVDDLGPHNPPSHPALLDELTRQFAAHGYRMSDLVRWIALTESFGLSSKLTDANLADAPERGERALFSRYYARQMQPEAVFDSLRLVAEARQSLDAETDRSLFLGQFSQRRGTDDGEEVDSFLGDVRQSLLLMTGPLMQRAVSSEQGAVLRQVLETQMTTEDKITHLFLASVARRPQAHELEFALRMIEQRGNVELALQDIWWALLNSSEFILDH